jgi:hypothetical protein
MRWREFIAGLGGVAASPIAARVQEQALPGDRRTAPAVAHPL